MRNIYALRRAGNYKEALPLARDLVCNDPDDDSCCALAWILIDICKYCISKERYVEARQFFEELDELDIVNYNDFTEVIVQNINRLRTKVDVNYALLSRAESLSKSGQEKEAFDLVTPVKYNLTETLHESFGWIVYRYLKSSTNSLSVDEVSSILNDYLQLKNDRPSLLHSVILSFALGFVHSNPNFDFYNFFLKWNPQMLRIEDLQESEFDDKKIKPLAYRVGSYIVKSYPSYEAKVLFSVSSRGLDCFREVYFGRLFELHKEQRDDALWMCFDSYASQYGSLPGSHWHSEILRLAERFMEENDKWRFLPFFRTWNPDNLREVDWQPEKGADGATYSPLAVKSIRKCFSILKSQPQRAEEIVSWLYKLFDKAIALAPDDEWLLRDKAMLCVWLGNQYEAINIYRNLVLRLGDQYYIWQEFASCVSTDNKLKIALLAKALSMQHNEDFLGEIHLDLASVLIDAGFLSNAAYELGLYKKHRDRKEWKCAPSYFSLLNKVSGVEVRDNRVLYKEYMPLALEYAYADIDWQKYVLVDKWTSCDSELGKFVSAGSSELIIKMDRYSAFSGATIGNVFKIKCVKKKIQLKTETSVVEKDVPVCEEKEDVEDWSIFPLKYGFIEYINKEKGFLHILSPNSADVKFAHIVNVADFAVGQFITFHEYKNKNQDKGSLEIVDVKVCPKEIALKNFKIRIVVVDDVNEDKRLFHYVLGRGLLTGIILFKDVSYIPQVGNFLKIKYCVRRDKAGIKKIMVFQSEVVSDKDDCLCRSFNGHLKVCYRDSVSGTDAAGTVKLPDFAFIDDYYVPKNLLRKLNIQSDCEVLAEAVYTGVDDKWKVFYISVV